MTEAEAAANWELPVEAVAEAADYCRHNAGLLQMEADEEKLLSQNKSALTP